MRAPVSYWPRARAIVAYPLGRQHLPTRRVAEAMADLFGLRISTGAVDPIYDRLHLAQLDHLPDCETSVRAGVEVSATAWARAGAVVETGFQAGATPDTTVVRQPSRRRL